MAVRETVWAQEPHTKAKHDILERYLGAWYPILANRNGTIVFYDGFAGPGRYKNGEPGSPIIAVKTLLDHDYVRSQLAHRKFVFLFNEENKNRHTELGKTIEDLKAEYHPWPSNISMQTAHGSFEETTQGLLDYLKSKDSNLAPTFAFVDPFGVKGLPMDLLAELVSFKACELLVFFDFNEVVRFATAGNIDHALSELYGTDAYKLADGTAGEERRNFLTDLYEDQIKSQCKFEYVQRFRMITKHGHSYFLFFGTRSLKGLEVMKNAMWRVAPSGDYEFSDKLAGQDVLFTPTASTLPLRTALLNQFAGLTVSVEEVEKYTLVHTPFTKSHLRQKTLSPMQKEGLITVPGVKRKGSFKPGCEISFA